MDMSDSEIRRWRKIAQDRKLSGATLKQFCKTRKISTRQFYYWTKKLERALSGYANARQQTPEATLEVQQLPIFLPLKLQPEESLDSREEFVKIVLRSGYEILVPASLSRSKFSEIIAALESEIC